MNRRTSIVFLSLMMMIFTILQAQTKRVYAITPGTVIPQSQMSITATSEETLPERNNRISNAIDGDPNTFWHTKWSGEHIPQSVTLDLGELYQDVFRVRYLPRQSGGLNGVITKFEISVSTDGVNFTKVAVGTWAADATEKTATFNSVPAKFVLINILGSADGKFGSAAEINVERKEGFNVAKDLVNAAVDRGVQFKQDFKGQTQALASLNKAIQVANELLSKTFVTQEDYNVVIMQIDNEIEVLASIGKLKSFKPGQPWLDTDGNLIQAHGGGIIYDEKSGKYYWYGEDKTNGYLPALGVHAYSSTDLYNWQDEGIVMKAVEKRKDLDNIPYFQELYKNRSKAEKDVIFSDINTARGVLERPKVIYNDKTGKYVLWLHVDGPYEGSDSNYAKAKAGVAISDSPTGPFEYLGSYRLNKVPEGYPYRVRNTGMSRDMTLFKDDDGTAYVIYSSEENYSLYISKLNEDYTNISGDKYGVDFIRAIYDGHREAPAMFKYAGKYYLITSGATGWDPNPAKYHIADSVLGTWKDMGNPISGAGAATTHGSQSTHVIPIDPANGKFIYMGDRWNKNDLKNSRYIWLPILLKQDGKMILNWYDEWSLSHLDKKTQDIDLLLQNEESVITFQEPNVTFKLKSIEHILNSYLAIHNNDSSVIIPDTLNYTGVYLYVERSSKLNNVEVEMELPYNKALFNADYKEESLKLYVYNPETKNYEVVENQTLDLEAKKITAKLTQFGDFILVGEKAPVKANFNYYLLLIPIGLIVALVPLVIKFFKKK